jgi:hypothetical protein
MVGRSVARLVSCLAGGGGVCGGGVIPGVIPGVVERMIPFTQRQRIRRRQKRVGLGYESPLRHAFLGPLWARTQEIPGAVVSPKRDPPITFPGGYVCPRSGPLAGHRRAPRGVARERRGATPGSIDYWSVEVPPTGSHRPWISSCVGFGAPCVLPSGARRGVQCFQHSVQVRDGELDVEVLALPGA